MLPITLLLAAAAAAFAPSVVARTPALVPPQGDGIATLAPDSDVRWVPFDLTPGNQIRFTLTLDARSLVAILDTGVSHSVLARKSAAADPAARVGGIQHRIFDFRRRHIANRVGRVDDEAVRSRIGRNGPALNNAAAAGAQSRSSVFTGIVGIDDGTGLVFGRDR